MIRRLHHCYIIHHLAAKGLWNKRFNNFALDIHKQNPTIETLEITLYKGMVNHLIGLVCRVPQKKIIKNSLDTLQRGQNILQNGISNFPPKLRELQPINFFDHSIFFLFGLSHA